MIKDITKYQWQLRDSDDGVFIRYDDHIDKDNKGRYNTTVIVKATVVADYLYIQTKSGSVYKLAVDMLRYPMHALQLKIRFGVDL